MHGNFAHPFKAFHAVAHAFREVFLLLTKIQTPVCLLICLSTGNTGAILTGENTVFVRIACKAPFCVFPLAVQNCIAKVYLKLL